jgi:hypothetical protein
MKEELAGMKNGPEMADTDDAMMQAALRNFRASAQAWSDAAYSRPRTVAVSQPGIAWRRTVGWVLSLAISVGVIGTALYERHVADDVSRQVQQQRQQEHQRLAAEQRAKETEDLLAKVDSDVARQVPSAMEPLAQLMDDSSQ